MTTMNGQPPTIEKAQREANFAFSVTVAGAFGATSMFVAAYLLWGPFGGLFSISLILLLAVIEMRIVHVIRSNR